MSRIGNRVLTIPDNVTISTENNVVTVKGPKGELSTKINEGIAVHVEENKLTLTRANENLKKFHGTANSNIENMIIGVTEGYTKKLEIVGVGYRFNAGGKKLTVNAGFSHSVEVEVPEGLSIECPSNTELIIQGIDKCLVGEFAANIRKIRKPEPYKGKGVRYSGEFIRRKEGKKAA